DVLAQLPVATNAHRQPRAIALPGLHLVIRRWGDLQLSTDRLDPKRLTVRVDERDHHFGLRSSSAWAKKADALRRISFARLSSRFSRSRSFSRSCSPVLNPARVP